MAQSSTGKASHWRCSTQSVLLTGAAARLALLMFGEWQDAHLQVKYTDVDYAVVTDAAAAVAAGGSPFERATYRYTPLLAWAALPNVWVHPAAGKLLFCAADIAAGWLMDALLRREGAQGGARAAAVAAWLFNPFTVTISTRGSGEALAACQLLGTLLALSTGHVVLAGALFGLAAHWRIYPVIYALPVLLSLQPPLTLPPVPAGRGGSFTAAGKQPACIKTSDSKEVPQEEQTGHPGDAEPLAAPCTASQQSGNGDGSGNGSSHSNSASAAALVRSLFSRQRLTFCGAAIAVFLGLAALFHRLYGWQFIQEAYLYHGQRRDPRHNFSPLYYPTYLALGRPHAGGTAVSSLATAAQLAAVAALGWRFAACPPVAWLLQTLAFVAFNKVVTAQYFVWYFSLAPLALCRLHPGSQGRVAVAAAAWTAAAAHWLAWAYLLEFRGVPVHLAVWAAGLVFLAANVALLCVLAVAFVQHGKAVQGAAPAVSDSRAGIQGVPVQTVIGGNGESRTH